MPLSFAHIYSTLEGHFFQCAKCTKHYPYKEIGSDELILCEECYKIFKIFYDVWLKMDKDDLPLLITMYKYDSLVEDKKKLQERIDNHYKVFRDSWIF